MEENGGSSVEPVAFNNNLEVSMKYVFRGENGCGKRHIYGKIIALFS